MSEMYLYEKGVWIKASRTTSAIIEELTKLQEISCTKVKGKYKGLDKVITRIEIDAIPLVGKEDVAELLTVHSENEEICEEFAHYNKNDVASSTIDVIYDYKRSKIKFKSDQYTRQLFRGETCTHCCATYKLKDILSEKVELNYLLSDAYENVMRYILSKICSLVNKSLFYYRSSIYVELDICEVHNKGESTTKSSDSKEREYVAQTEEEYEKLQKLLLNEEDVEHEIDKSKFGKETEILERENFKITKDALASGMKAMMLNTPDNLVKSYISFAEEMLFLEDEGDITTVTKYCDSASIGENDTEKCMDLFYYIIADLIAKNLKSKIDLAFVTDVNDEERELFSIRIEVIFAGGLKQIFMKPMKDSKKLSAPTGHTSQHIYDISNPTDYMTLQSDMVELIQHGICYSNKVSSDWELIIKSL